MYVTVIGTLAFSTFDLKPLTVNPETMLPSACFTVITSGTPATWFTALVTAISSPVRFSGSFNTYDVLCPVPCTAIDFTSFMMSIE